MTRKYGTLITVFCMIFVVFALFNNSDSAETNIDQSISDANINEHQAIGSVNEVEFDNQITRLQEITNIPGVDSIELTYEVEETHHVEWQPGDMVLFEGLTLEEQREWLAKQETPRTQKKILIQTITPDGWGYEDIFEPGPIIPVARDQREFYNFTDKTHLIDTNVHDDIVTERTFTMGTAAGCQATINAYRSPSELLGLFENLPFYDGSSEYEVQISQIADVIVKRFVSIPTEDLMLEAKFEAGNLTNAIYYEEPFAIREFEFKDYQLIGSLGQEVPHQILLKRYSNTKIDQRSDENLLDSYKYAFVSAKTNF